MAEKGSNGSEAGGNTNPQPKSERDSPKVKWCFTLNLGKKEDNNKEYYIELVGSKIKSLDEYCKYYIVSLECVTRWHLQGYIEFKTKKRFAQVKQILWKEAHIEASKGSREDNNIYCMKEAFHTWKKEEAKKNDDYTADELGLIKIEQLYDWQREVIENINKPAEKRVINWYWSKSGNVGKTEFIKYLCFHHNALFAQGAKKDIMNSLFGNDNKVSIKDRLGLNPIIILGFSRTVEDYVSYDSIESLKDGLLFNSKYESKFSMIPTPHIYIFCNFEPDYEKLSLDRWNVFQIDAVARYDESSDSSQRSHSSRRTSSVSSERHHIEALKGSSPSPGGRVRTSVRSSAPKGSIKYSGGEFKKFFD